MENVLFNIDLYEAQGKIIDADNIIPIEKYLNQKKRAKQRKAKLLRDGFVQKASGLLLIGFAIFISKIVGVLDSATGCVLIIGTCLTLTKQRVFY